MDDDDSNMSLPLSDINEETSVVVPMTHSVNVKSSPSKPMASTYQTTSFNRPSTHLHLKIVGSGIEEQSTSTV